MGKYNELQERCRRRDWSAWLFPVEDAEDSQPNLYGKCSANFGGDRKKGCRQTWTSSRKGIHLAVDDERGEELDAKHTDPECLANTADTLSGDSPGI
ncbi:hypothetical protein DPMN_129113 [Dreissena polymorpha]|uniref:Uncharacterized protein n=1 Tax=Dreissena polymorpha TaxID=45954 RepID=A0A9D4H222_DREPO|nr:hypothetical protein DPMN_129113 [Dreissena polymorpha]